MFSIKVRLHGGGDLEGIRELLQHIPPGEARQFLEADIPELVDGFASTCGCCCVSARLDSVASPMCPRLHADSVPLRMLVTYAGAGTAYAINAAVDRTRLAVPPGAAGNDGAVRPGFELCEASRGDVLLLKGNAWPGNQGCGAIHRSPRAVSEERPRLLLTVDPA